MLLSIFVWEFTTPISASRDHRMFNQVELNRCQGHEKKKKNGDMSLADLHNN